MRKAALAGSMRRGVRRQDTNKASTAGSGARTTTTRWMSSAAPNLTVGSSGMTDVYGRRAKLEREFLGVYQRQILKLLLS